MKLYMEWRDVETEKKLETAKKAAERTTKASQETAVHHQLTTAEDHQTEKERQSTILEVEFDKWKSTGKDWAEFIADELQDRLGVSHLDLRGGSLKFFDHEGIEVFVVPSMERFPVTVHFLAVGRAGTQVPSPSLSSEPRLHRKGSYTAAKKPHFAIDLGGPWVMSSPSGRKFGDAHVSVGFCSWTPVAKPDACRPFKVSSDGTFSGPREKPAGLREITLKWELTQGKHTVWTKVQTRWIRRRHD